MSESTAEASGDLALSLPGVVPALVEELSHVGSCGSEPTDAPAGERLQLLEELERLKAAAAAAQARVTATFMASETQRVEAARVAARREGRVLPRATLVVGAQVALARRESPARGRRYAEASVVLVRDLPHTLAALTRGDVDEERALLVVRATQDVSPTDRRVIDAQLAGPAGPTRTAGDDEREDGSGPSAMADLGVEALRQMIQRLAFSLDDEVASRRMRRARAERRVTGRVLGDGTGRITAIVPSEHYASILTALAEATSSAKAAGDTRTRDQIKADVLTARLTGSDTARATPIVTNLVISVESLLGHSSAPGYLLGATTTTGRRIGNNTPGGYVPAGLCADLLLEAATDHRATLRRLFTAPDSGELVAMERASRYFDWHLAAMINVRDGGTCRTRWCDAPIRHVDHAVPYREVGETSYDNGQGLCEACNLVKETPGWTTWVTVGADGRHEVGTLTPHQHLHTSRPPPVTSPPRRPNPPAGVAPGTRWAAAGGSRSELHLGTLVELTHAS